MRTGRQAGLVVAVLAVLAVPSFGSAGGLAGASAPARDGVTSPAVVYLQSQLGAGDGASQDSFGGAVAVAGDTIVVGAADHAVGGNKQQGVAYVFTAANGDWSQARQVAELTAGDGAAGDAFGGAVAIAGNTIVVGADGHMVGGNSDQGAVYVFTTANGHWTDARQAAELTAADGAASDQFGHSVAIAGNAIAVGAPYRTVGGNTEQGAVYVFAKPASSNWAGATQAGKLTAGDGAAKDDLGGAVAIAGDAIVAGSPGHASGGNSSQGAVYVFAEPAGGWVNATQTAELVAGDGDAGDGFGVSVAVSGHTVVAGAPGHPVGGNPRGAAYVFAAANGNWADVAQAARLTAGDGATSDLIGYSVAVAGDTVVVGAPFHAVGGNSRQGAAYVFVKPAGGWANATQTTELTAGNGASNDLLGARVAVAGRTLVAGAPYRDTAQGSVYVFGGIVAPTLGHVTQSHKAWRLGSAKPRLNPAHHAKAGTVFSFTLNTAATVTLHFVQQVGGRTVSRGTLTVQAPAGRDHVYVAGSLGHHHRLRAGRYAVTIRARDAAGASAAKTLHFTAKPA